MFEKEDAGMAEVQILYASAGVLTEVLNFTVESGLPPPGIPTSVVRRNKNGRLERRRAEVGDL